MQTEKNTLWIYLIWISTVSKNMFWRTFFTTYSRNRTSTILFRKFKIPELNGPGKYGY